MSCIANEKFEEKKPEWKCFFFEAQLLLRIAYTHIETSSNKSHPVTFYALTRAAEANLCVKNYKLSVFFLLLQPLPSLPSCSSHKTHWAPHSWGSKRWWMNCSTVEIYVWAKWMWARVLLLQDILLSCLIWWDQNRCNLRSNYMSDTRLKGMIRCVCERIKDKQITFRLCRHKKESIEIWKFICYLLSLLFFFSVYVSASRKKYFYVPNFTPHDFQPFILPPREKKERTQWAQEEWK